MLEDEEQRKDHRRWFGDLQCTEDSRTAKLDSGWTVKGVQIDQIWTNLERGTLHGKLSVWKQQAYKSAHEMDCTAF